MEGVSPLLTTGNEQVVSGWSCPQDFSVSWIASYTNLSKECVAREVKELGERAYALH